MRADLRLTWRLLRSGDHRAVIRTALTALGVAVGVVACLVALSIPLALDAADARNAARTPFGERTGTGLHYSASVELLDGKPWTRAMVSGTAAGSPRPPGVSAWPAVGQTMVSPALAQALATRSDGDVLARNVIPARIGVQGLRSPDEFMSYTVTADAGSDVVIEGFGDPRARGQTVSVVMVAELLFVVGLPSVVFLATVLRLSFLSRRDRSAALLRIGVSPRRTARMFATEMAVVAAVGAAVGVGGYLLVEPWLGSWGVLGLSWLPGDASYPLPGEVVVVLISLLVTYGVAHRVMRGQAGGEWVERAGSSWRSVVGTVLLLPAVTASVTFVLIAREGRRDTRVLPEQAYVATVLACAVAGAVGVYLTLPALIRAVSSLVSRVGPTVGLRLGARLSRFHAGAVSTMVLTMAAMVFLAGAAEAVLYGTYLDGVGDLSRVTVQVALPKDPASRRALTELRGPVKVVQLVSSTSVPVPGAGVSAQPSLFIADCAAYRSLTIDMPFPRTCTGQPQQLVGDTTGWPALTPGTILALPTIDGTPVRLRVPASRYGDYGGGLLIPPKDAPWLTRVAQANVIFQASALDGSYDRLLAQIHRLAPDAQPTAQYKDAEALARYTQQTAILRAGIAAGFILALLAFLISVADLRWRNAQVRAAQLAIGAPRRLLLQSGLTQTTLPVAGVLLVVTPFTLATGYFFTGYWGTQYLFPTSVTRAVLLLSAVAVGLSALAGTIISRGRFDLDALSEDN